MNQETQTDTVETKSKQNDSAETDKETEHTPQNFTKAIKCKATAIVEKGKKLSKKAKITICAAIALILIAVFLAAFSSPFVGKWYSSSSTDPVIEIKGNGTAVFSVNPEASVSWEKIEDNVIKLKVVDLSRGYARQSTYLLSYGKTNNGIKYITDGEMLLFKSYDDAQKIEEAAGTESGSLKDGIGKSGGSSSKSSNSSKKS